MKTYTFHLYASGIKLSGDNIDVFVDSLYEVGCHDAMVCVIDGAVRVDFDREARSEEWAILTAKADLKAAYRCI